jgi:hypothetical protein
MSLLCWNEEKLNDYCAPLPLAVFQDFVKVVFIQPTSAREISSQNKKRHGVPYPWQ